MRVGVVERLRLTIKPLDNRAEKPSDTLRRLKAAISPKIQRKTLYAAPTSSLRSISAEVFLFIKYDKFTSVSPSPSELWKIEFYADEDDSFPVRVWLDSVPEEVRGKVLARINLLKTGGPTLDFPYTSQIEGKLREARLRVGKTRYRVLYFFDEARTAVLLHGFTKATAAVEEADKKIGRTRMARHEAKLAAKSTSKPAVNPPAKEKKRR
jgi:hypothetical protein